VSAVQDVALLLVAASGTAVALTRDPLRQALLTGLFGLALATTFFVFQAPDVALSQVVVGTVALPVMILLTLAKLRETAAEQREDEAGEDE
jgi:energy-converting hydrogenase B subunit D